MTNLESALRSAAMQGQVDEKPLSPELRERLEILAEENGEVVQATMKVLRHGFLSWNPYREQDGSNRTQLEREIGHVIAAVELLREATDINWQRIDEHVKAKLISVKQWLHHPLEKKSTLGDASRDLQGGLIRATDGTRLIKDALDHGVKIPQEDKDHV